MHTGITALASKRRTPSGQYSRAGTEREFAPTRVKRLRDSALAGIGDPEWGSEIGRLFLQKVITPEMYAAGRRWAEQAAKYRRAIGVFPIRSTSAEPTIRSAQPDPESEEGRAIAKREADHAERFFAAHAALLQGGMLTESIVRRACEDDEPIVGIGDLMKLRTGLMLLATHWDLTSRGKSVSAEKAR